MNDILVLSAKIQGVQTETRELLHGCIDNVFPYAHKLNLHDTLSFSADSFYHVFVLISGEVLLRSADGEVCIHARATFIPKPRVAFDIVANKTAEFLELRMGVLDGDDLLLQQYATSFPYVMPYQDSKQYWDRHKTSKTIPRIMVEQRTIPRFSMGSCESIGPDHIIAHAHPMLDQYFYSFPENKSLVTIDAAKLSFGGNMLLYIPLGSNHGSEVAEGEHLHYVWIDYFSSAAGMERLDTMHQATGKTRTLEDLAEK